MIYPIRAYSWLMESPDTAIKELDKSAFIDHGTGVPNEITDFFGVTPQELSAPRRLARISHE